MANRSRPESSRRRGQKTLIVLRFVTLGLGIFVTSGWLYLNALSVKVEKSPVVLSAPVEECSRDVTLEFAVPGSSALERGIGKHPTTDDLSEAVRAATEYLVQVTNENGSFVYRQNLNPQHTPGRRYNILRHAGTIYALAQSHDWQADESVRDAVLRSSRYLKSMTIAPVPTRPELLAVWSRPELTGVSAPVKAKLGGAGLALVALTSANRLAPNETSLDYLRRLGQFVLFMQQSDGGFYSRYDPSAGGRDDKWTSLYYPGEAALGLVMLYEQDPDERWLQAAANAMGYLARIRKGKTRVAADHWALIATKRILESSEKVELAVTREIMVEHAAQVCHSILAEKPSFNKNHLFHGGFARDGRTCPTATRLEGLVDALSFLPAQYEPLKRRMRVAVKDGTAFLLRAQIVSGEHAGGMARAIGTLPASHPDASDAFNRRATELRIDYVQHAMCAMIQFERRKEALRDESSK